MGSPCRRTARWLSPAARIERFDSGMSPAEKRFAASTMMARCTPWRFRPTAAKGFRLRPISPSGSGNSRPKAMLACAGSTGIPRRYSALSFAPGDQLALSASADRTVRVWDVATGQISGTPLYHDSAVVALATTGGDGFLAGCDDGTIWLWDLRSRQRVRRLKAPAPILSIAGSPLGHRALSGHADGVLVLWDIDLGTEIGRMVGHGDLVRSAALLPDGHRALAGSQFGHLILWDIDSQRELRRIAPAALESLPAGELGLGVFADDVHALSADTDGAVRLWRLPADVGLTAPVKRRQVNGSRSANGRSTALLFDQFPGDRPAGGAVFLLRDDPVALVVAPLTAWWIGLT